MFAINSAFGGEIDYAVLMKKYGDSSRETAQMHATARLSASDARNNSRRAIPIRATSAPVISSARTSPGGCRCTASLRLTNAFSKKIENHIASLAIHYMHDNFVRIHQSLRITPAMAAGLSDRVWSLEYLIGLIE